MTAEKTMELVYEMAKAASSDMDEYKEFTADIHNPKWVYHPIYSNAQILIEDCLKTLDKKSNGKIDMKSLMKIINNAGDKANLSGKWLSDGKYCFCDGFIGIRIDESYGKFDSIPDVDGVNLDAIIDNLNREKLIEIPALVPTIGELKANKAKWKAETGGKKYINGYRNKPTYDFGEGLPLVDTEFLEIMLKVLPGSTVYMVEEKLISPLYFKNEFGDGILCPVRKYV